MTKPKYAKGERVIYKHHTMTVHTHEVNADGSYSYDLTFGGQALPELVPETEIEALERFEPIQAPADVHTSDFHLVKRNRETDDWHIKKYNNRLHRIY